MSDSRGSKRKRIYEDDFPPRSSQSPLKDSKNNSEIVSMDIDENTLSLIHSNLADVRKGDLLAPEEGGEDSIWTTSSKPEPEPKSDSPSKKRETIKRYIFVVVDTNILLSHLDLVRKLLSGFEKGLPGRGAPSAYLVIPWMVVKELDKIKEGSSYDDSVKQLSREAVRFLRACLKKSHRVVGQVPHHVPSGKNLDIKTNDDKILQCCLFLIQKHVLVRRAEGSYPKLHFDRKREAMKAVGLLTNDNNLSVKALFHGLSSFSAGEVPNDWGKFFKENISREDENGYDNARREESQKLKENTADSERGGVNKRVRRSSVNGSIASNEKLRVASLESVTAACKELEKVLDVYIHECFEFIFGSDWEEMAKKKPPWVLKDMLFLIDKHWISVFTDFSSQKTLQITKKVSEVLKYDSSSLNGQCFSLLCDIGALLQHLIEECKRNRDYKFSKEVLQLMQTALDTVENLKEKLVEKVKSGDVPKVRKSKTQDISNETPNRKRIQKPSTKITKVEQKVKTENDETEQKQILLMEEKANALKKELSLEGLVPLGCPLIFNIILNVVKAYALCLQETAHALETGLVSGSIVSDVAEFYRLFLNRFEVICAPLHNFFTQSVPFDIDDLILKLEEFLLGYCGLPSPPQHSAKNKLVDKMQLADYLLLKDANYSQFMAGFEDYKTLGNEMVSVLDHVTNKFSS
eukprot:Nk52_evm41s1671 gene=Nk52_evmTU41s1671